jgi:serine/threonine protein kinase
MSVFPKVMHAVVQDTAVGLTLGDYRLVKKIGAGGVGEVYRARDEHLSRDVAIKVLPLDTLTNELARKHFHKGILNLSQVDHTDVATIHDFDTQQGMDFLVIAGTIFCEFHQPTRKGGTLRTK